MNEQAFALPLLWLEEAEGPLALAAAFGVAIGVAAWMRAVSQLRQRTAPPSILDYARGIVALHDSLYQAVAGVHPHRRLWHCGWLSVKDLYVDFRPLFESMTGRVLDVGCLGKPYRSWLVKAESHLGLDVAPSPTVDVVISPGRPWDVDPSSFDHAICTQVIQVVRDPHEMLEQIERALKPGALAVFAAPFAYNDMSEPRVDGVYDGVYKDYWRCSIHGFEDMISKHFEIVEVRRQGGIGSTAGGMLLNWIRISMTRRFSTSLLFFLLMPLWLVLSLAVNVVGWTLDKLDRTGAFYHNVLIIARKSA